MNCDTPRRSEVIIVLAVRRTPVGWSKGAIACVAWRIGAGRPRARVGNTWGTEFRSVAMIAETA